MSKQTFLSKDFFVTASEKDALQTILAIPQSVSHIRFLSENSVAPSWRFTYDLLSDSIQYYVDVSVLALSDTDTRVMLHIAHTNGAAFKKDKFITSALLDFEAAVLAAMQGRLSAYALQETRANTKSRALQQSMSVAASLSLFFLLKKHA